MLTHLPVPEYPSESMVVPVDRSGLPPGYPSVGPFTSKAENQAALAYQAVYGNFSAAGGTFGVSLPGLSPRAEVGGVSVPEDHLHWPGEVVQSMTDVRSHEPPRAMGQFLNSFIVASDRFGLFVIDKHVAHERILYDQSLAQMGRRAVPIQRLLVPRTIFIPAAQRASLSYLMPELNASGFECELYGEDIVIQSVPVVAKEAAVDQIVKEILDALEGADRRSDLMEVRKRIAISMACRSAIKINTPLSPEKMQWLLDELYRAENPTTCPHGRPVLFRLGLHEILRNFKRL
jgi:DNA mismatch repair protein MutL